MATNPATPNGFAQRQFARRCLAQGHALALALLIAPFAMSGSAEAVNGCTPATTPLPNTTVDCIGTINNANGNGFGTAADSGNQITVESGASVTGSTNGVEALGPSKVINLGTITGNEGIRGSDSTVVDNSGNISGNLAGVDGVSHLINRTTGNITSSGNSSDAVLAGGTIDNDGHITATGAASVGIKTVVGALIVNNTSTGFITATGAGSLGIANQAIDGTIVLTNSGTVSGGAFGVFGFVGLGNTGDVTVTNLAGTISATDAAGVAIFAGRTATVSNSSTIQANGTDGVAIKSSAGTVNVTDNSGTIQATGTRGVAISGATVNIISSTGTISAADIGIFASNTDREQFRPDPGDSRGRHRHRQLRLCQRDQSRHRHDPRQDIGRRERHPLRIECRRRP